EDGDLGGARRYLGGARPERGCAALCVTVVHDGGRARAFGERAHLLGAVSEDGDDVVHAGRAELVDLVLDERFARPLKQRLGDTHAAGLSGGEENGRDHAFWVLAARAMSA